MQNNNIILPFATENVEQFISKLKKVFFYY